MSGLFWGTVTDGCLLFIHTAARIRVIFFFFLGGWSVPEMWEGLKRLSALQSVWGVEHSHRMSSHRSHLARAWHPFASELGHPII